MKHKFNKTFFGTATLGEKGQVVIPAKARKALELNKGEELLVFGMASDMIVISKLSMVQDIVNHLSRDIKTMRKAISKIK